MPKADEWVKEVSGQPHKRERWSSSAKLIVTVSVSDPFLCNRFNYNHLL